MPDNGARSCSRGRHRFQAGIGLAALDRLLVPLRRSSMRSTPTMRRAVGVARSGRRPPPSELVLCSALFVAETHRTAAPLVILCDDTQWLDVPSKVVLAFAARRLAGSHTGIVMVVRSGADELIEAARFPTLIASPLEPESATELLQRRYPTLAPRVRQRIHEEAQGNPLTLLEVPSTLSEAQRAGHADLPDRLPVSRRMGALFAPQVSQLAPRTRELLLLLALDVSEPPSQLLEPDDERAGADLEAAVRTGLLSRHRGDQGMSFSHPLARAAVVEMATELELRRAHRRLAQMSTAGSARRVLHLAAAAVGVNEPVASALDQLSGDRLRRGDARGALAASIRAAELTGDDAARARRFLHAAHIGAEVTGDLATAARLVSAANTERPDASALEAAVAASYLLVNAEAEVDAAHRLLVAATARHSAPTDAADAAVIEALHSLVMLSWWSGRAELWEPVRTRLDQLRPGPPPLLELCAATFGDPARLGAPLLATAATVTAGLAQQQDPIEITRVAIACVYLDRVGECREALGRVIADGRAGGAVALAINAIVSSCVDDWLTGQWDEALALAAEGQQLCEQYGYRRYSFILGGYIHALIQAARGDVEGPLAAAEELVRWGAARGAGMAVQFACHVRTIAALALDDNDDAFRHATAVSPAGELRPYTPHALWLALDVVEAAIGSNRLEAAHAHVAAMQAANLPAISSRLALVTHGSAAMVASADAGSGTAAESVDALFTRALTVPGAHHWPFELARIRLAYGEHLRRRRALQGASTQLWHAFTLFDTLNAGPWRTRAANALRAAGHNVDEGGDRDLTKVTAHQWRIVHLAAAGLTNRQIGEQLGISHRTVGAALYQLFPKLGVTSRAELRDALTALGQDPPAAATPMR